MSFPMFKIYLLCNLSESESVKFDFYFFWNEFEIWNEFVKPKRKQIHLVPSSDGANRVLFSTSEIPTAQTEFSSYRRKSRQCKPSLVLNVGSSDSANRVLFSTSEVPTGQTKSSSYRWKSRRRKPSLIVIVGTSILLVSTLSIWINLQNLYCCSSFILSTNETLALAGGLFSITQSCKLYKVGVFQIFLLQTALARNFYFRLLWHCF